jgi:TetR/AcrR family transcriptional repressor of nem operon
LHPDAKVMAGRPRTFETELLIDRAIEVFWTKGYVASSADELLKAMQIGQGSFYSTFKGGKRELFEKSLIQFSNKAVERFNANLNQSSDSIEFLKLFFLVLANSSKEKKLKGCYLGNAIVELTNTDVNLKKLAAKLLTRLEESFKNIIDQAQKDGRIKNKTSSKIIAKHLINLWNGINITRRLYPDEENIKAIIELNLEVLK